MLRRNAARSRRAPSRARSGPGGCGEAIGDQVVAAADMETLVRLAEERELGLLDEADQVEEVERALDVGLGAVFDVVRDVQQLCELRVAPAGDRLVEVLRDRHLVELEPALREAVVEGRVAGGLRVVAPDLRRALDVCGRLREAVALAVEPGRQLDARRLGRVDVVELEVELARKPPDLAVACVDELAAVLPELPVVEDTADRPAAPADTTRCLVDVGPVARLLQPVRTGQPGKAAPDDDDPRAGRGVRESAQRARAGDRERERARIPEEGLPRRALLVGVCRLNRRFDPPRKRRPCHRSPPAASMNPSRSERNLRNSRAK